MNRRHPHQHFVFSLACLAALLAAGTAFAAPPSRSAALAKRGQHAATTEDASAAAASSTGVVNLNTATEAELTRLPGVGPKKAHAIVELRSRVHRFTKIEEVLRVRGIGRATFRKLRPMLRLEGPTTLAGPTPKKTAKNSGESPKD